MNSNSRCHHDNDCDCDCVKEKECKMEKKEVCPTIIKCSAPGAVTIPDATAAGTKFTPASLTLNTNCICNPCVKLEVASNVVTTGWTGSVSFQVFKQCSNQFTAVPVGPSFTFSRPNSATIADTFTFFICDCDSCFHDCCTYTVVVTTNTATTGTLAINNLTIGAVATCQTNGCCF